MSKGRNFTRGDNSGKIKYIRQLFFHEESLHEVSRRYLEPPYIHTRTHTHTQTHTYKPKPIYPTFSKLGATTFSIINTVYIRELIY